MPCKKKVTGEAAARFFFENVWKLFGLPNSIVSDRDSRFLSKFWCALWAMMDTKLKRSTAFHPQSDGQTEVVNKTIVHLLRGYNARHPKTWDESIPFLQFAINHTLHSSTNKSLSEVCSGFSPQSPFDLEFTIESTSQLEKGEGDRIRAQRFVDQIRKIHHKVEQQLQKAQQKYKERHDRHHKQGNFQEGDLVWLHLGKDRLLGEGKKLRPIRCGPFKIIRKIGDNACQLELPAFMEMYSVVNVEKLKLFEPSMLDDEPNGTLPTVEDLVTEKEVILSWRGKQLPPDVAQGNPSGSEEKANVQVRQNGSHGKLDKLSFLVSNSRTSRSWLVLAREAMIWDDRWLTPGLVCVCVCV
ncbi:hypothetical protein NC653_018750 [Populus alba x Populus x berolinensis]|uniref:Integrase catalytic domain-containing protein n=1 Tax=Populus alba x Populus x berolinensis TaxID=444605 RepID=A0AAD6QH76_9ROSI|nr:hypothetical protein NC653_018750 [Populus alba x Populus x berolinensis]